MPVSVEELYPGGVTLELQEDGRAILSMGASVRHLRWSLEGEHFSAGTLGTSLEGSLYGGVLILINVMDTGVDLTLVRTGEAN